VDDLNVENAIDPRHHERSADDLAKKEYDLLWA